MMQPISAKELEYLVDSMSNEDLLMKQCAVAAATVSNQALRQQCMQLQQTHQQQYDMLLQALAQHQQLAPTQPQQ
ncbi:hypothetical protein PA598K_03145 [Paenibacillus sp. 598K]|uniref:hypothetical protein n=1 Tax=Paenibacillus sp. 598K TaxID=1117987 RepID=UPI000FFA023C|nr:hypothetical protein [Paenibacillus sp. 598K]GBF74778.1 hypothetical protein PA598K_03145 [Paenibacillus sp. 598K]